MIDTIPYVVLGIVIVLWTVLGVICFVLWHKVIAHQDALLRLTKYAQDTEKRLQAIERFDPFTPIDKKEDQ
ncbi:hypothetical protein CMI37_09010 [Candidatus Pacearchaeota archaeon]|nr:hypothetical protein [Candidatus Pacearchaeota archaeon]|tara:strand:+ start:473 stop:685 length:213 start_codon:yes stop_codon:yes gene_type:complete